MGGGLPLNTRQPKNQFIQLDDWFRILFGATSPNFLIEVLFRAFFVYLILLLSMRLMGKRMANQLSRNEMAALVSLAAAIGVPLLDAHRGLLAALVIALVIIGIERLVARLVIGHPGFEAVTQSTPSVLVENGVMQRDEMRQTLVTRERLFAQLRSNSLEHLGQVNGSSLNPAGPLRSSRRWNQRRAWRFCRPGTVSLPHKRATPPTSRFATTAAIPDNIRPTSGKSAKIVATSSGSRR